jgi:lycopene beta-cyclase
MSRDPFFVSKTIAIVDQDLNKGNDRTWCFWETTPDLFEEVVSYTWPSVLIKGNGMNQTIDILPYAYKKVESEAMYAFAKAELSTYSNITLIQDNVIDTNESDTQVRVILKTQTLTTKHLLNSIYKPEILAHQQQKIVLQQHFIGWFVQTKEAVFTPKVATYMDFSVPQKGNCRFMYVLPTSQPEALLEYTLFSKELLHKTEYEQAIKEYLAVLGVTDFKIAAREQGSIPMTTYDFTQHNTTHIVHIGTAGGWTKASTGYTFKHAVKKSKDLVSFLKSGKDFTHYKLKNRWTFYDSVLLEALAKHNNRGAQIFTGMFKKGNAGPIFRFLDEESSLWDDLKVIWSAPKWLFTKAAFRVIFRSLMVR